MCHPAGLWSGRICETLTDNPFIKPVKQGWQMRLHIPKMPTIFKAMGEWRSRQRIASWQTQSSSRVRLYHSQILRRDSELNLTACWLNDSDRAYMVSVSGFYKALKSSQNTFHPLKEGFGYNAAYQIWIWLSYTLTVFNLSFGQIRNK